MNNEVKVTKACIQIRWKVLNTKLLLIINQEELVEPLTCALEELKKMDTNVVGIIMAISIYQQILPLKMKYQLRLGFRCIYLQTENITLV